MKDKKGFTIVEIVVALVIISIVSLTATTIVLSGQAAQKKSHDKFFAVNLCNNSISVFLSAAKESEDFDGMYELFGGRIKSALDIDAPEELEVTTGEEQEESLYVAAIYFDGSWKQTNEEDGKFTCEMSFVCRNSFVTLSISIRNSNELYSTSYMTTLGGAL